jgi:hypothetical protein
MTMEDDEVMKGLQEAADILDSHDAGDTSVGGTKYQQHQQANKKLTAMNIGESGPGGDASDDLVKQISKAREEMGQQQTMHAGAKEGEPTEEEGHEGDDGSNTMNANSVTFEDASLDNMSQITGLDDLSVVASSVDGGASLETGGSKDTPNTGMSSKTSKKRQPSDPTKYNAVTVHVSYASGIRQWDASCDPFALVTVGKVKTTFEEKLTHLDNTGYHDSLYETRALENTSEPEWNEACTLAFPTVEEAEKKKLEVHIQIQDKDMSTNDDLGEARIRLTKFVCDDENNPTEAELPLVGPGAGDNDPSIYIRLNFTNVEDYTDAGSTVSGSLVSEQNLEASNRRELLHPGEWVAEVWQVGKLKPWTRYWTCCGCDKHLSMYCPSLGDRVAFAHKLAERNEYLRLKPIKEAKAKETRDRWLEEKRRMKDARLEREILIADNDGEEPPSDAEKKHFFMSKEWKIKRGIWREAKTDTFNEAHGADENDLYEHRMRMVKPADISMVVGTMR